MMSPLLSRPSFSVWSRLTFLSCLLACFFVVSFASTRPAEAGKRKKQRQSKAKKSNKRKRTKRSKRSRRNRHKARSPRSKRRRGRRRRPLSESQKAARSELTKLLQSLEKRSKKKHWNRPKPSWRAYKLPRHLGTMPVPLELIPRVLLWYRVFGLYSHDSLVLFSKKELFFLGTLQVKGAGLVPGDGGKERRRKTRVRASAAVPVVRKLRTQLKELAAIEAKVERKERIYWWKLRKKCRLFETRKEQRRCWKLLRVRPRLYRKSQWRKAFAGASPALRKLWKLVRRDPRIRGPRFHNVFRPISRAGVSWLSSYRAFFLKGLKMHRHYHSKIKSILKKANLPVHLAALPFVESMYNPWVKSYVGALGLWQLMPLTGKELGLFVPSKKKIARFLPPIDERFDPIYATQAAARFIKFCRRYFKKNWPLAITSYNQGPGRVLKVARRVRSKYLPDLIRKARKKHFGYDGRNFYAKFLASALLLKRAEDVFDTDLNDALAFRKVRLRHPLWISQLKRWTGLNKETLKLYNPMLMRLLRYPTHPIPAYFPLRLPVSRARRLVKKAKKLLRKGPSTREIEADEGDSLYRIARRYGVPLKLLASVNKDLVELPDRCEELGKLRKAYRRWRRLRRRRRTRKKAGKRPPWTSNKRRDYRRNCQLWRVLRKRLEEDSTVYIPAIRRASQASIRIYRVRGNEPMSWIACRACTTVWHIRALNPKLPIRRLLPGMSLRVPYCPLRRRRLFKACYLYHYSRKRARRSRRLSRRTRRRQRKAGD